MKACPDNGEACGAQAQFRDSDPQLVFQCAMLWGTYCSNIKTIVGAETFKDLDGMFCRGAFDVPLGAQVKLRDENSKLEHLSFMQSYLDAPVQMSETSKANDADFKLFKIRLQLEETSWSQHLARVKHWYTKTHESKVDLQEKMHTLRVEKVEKHADECYPVRVCANYKSVAGLVSSMST